MEKTQHQSSILTRSFLLLSNLSSHPLFSILTTSSLLILLYLPRLLLPVLFSPVLISTLILLTALLRFGSTRPETPSNSHHVPVRVANEPDTEITFVGSHQKPNFSDSFFEWGRPLEVIYEAYEGEEEGDSPVYSQMGTGKIGSLGFCYTDSDTGSDSGGESPVIKGWDSPENLCFRWDEEGDELIEIALEEENLIEIDISGCR